MDLIAIGVAAANGGSGGGTNGKDGKDGYSPTVNVTEIDNGHKVNITDKNGTKSFDVLNGKKGDKGDKGDTGSDGKDGSNGKDGYTPVKGTDYWTEDDKSAIVNEVAAQTYLKSTIDSKFKTANDDISANTEAIKQNKTDISSLDDKISSLTLGLHTDGLFYIFVNGEPIGNGISLPKASGDVYGNVDSGNNIILNGDLADGEYFIKYEMSDGSTIDIGELVLSADIVEPTYNNILTSGDYEIQLNKRWSNSAKGYSDCNGMISFLIPILDVLNKTIRFKGFTVNATASGSKALWMTINASNEKVSLLRGTESGNGVIWESTYLTNTNEVYSLIVNDTTFGGNSNATYLAINMAVSSSAIDTLPSGLIMTIDEEIE